MSEAYGSSTVKRRRRSDSELAEVDEAIIAAVRQEYPVTLRGVYYRVVSAGAVEKTELGYRLVMRQLLKLRRTGAVPYHWITDGTRWITAPPSWRDVDQMLSDAADSYRRQLWRDQNAEVHIFTEKDAISGVILPVTDRWIVPLGVLRGYASESFAYNVAQAIRHTGKPTYVYQLGDHDPSGLGAWRDFQDKVTGFLGDAAGRLIGAFERLSVTPEQIEQWQLPTRPTKATDSRARKFAGESVEVDSISPRRLRELVEAAIVQHIDPHALRITEVAENSEREFLRRLSEGVWG